MRGVSEVIAIILILMITIAIAGLAYTFMSSTMASTTSASSSAVTTTTSSMLTSFVIENMDSNILYIRNTGQNVLSNLIAYVDEIQVTANMTPLSIEPGSVGTVTINDYMRYGSTVKIAAQNGMSATRVAQDQCYGAVSCWKFDEGYGSSVKDYSGNTTGTLSSMNITGNATSGWARSRFGNALRFDGIDDTATMDYYNLNFANETRALSISAWIYPTNCTQNVGPQQYYIGVKFSYPNSGWWIYMTSMAGICYVKFATCDGICHGAGSATSTPIITNQWTHIVGWSNGTANKVFINSVESNVTASGTVMDSPTAPFRLSTSSDGYEFVGMMDEIAIWNHALTQEQISAIYNRVPY